jgi:hypothetical protein
MELVWKLQIFLYIYASLNSYAGRSRQIGSLGNLPDFSKHVGAPNKFSSNLKVVLLPGILIQILFGI